MKVTRREFSRSLIISAAFPGFVKAQAVNWPTKPIRLVVGLAAGGLADVLARQAGIPLTKAFGQSVLIENRGGAGGNIAGVEVVRNGNDGHTFLVAPTTLESVNPLIFSKMPFDVHQDLAPVGLLANSHLFLFVRASLPVGNLHEFIAYAMKNDLTYGSAGNGTTPHLAAELFKKNAKFEATHAPYRGAAPALQDVMGGQIDFAFGPASALQAVKSGKLKVLAVASKTRSVAAPDIPTFDQSGVSGVYADSMFGIYAPIGVSSTILNKFGQHLNAALQSEDIQKKFIENGAEALPLSRAEFVGLVQAEKKLFQPTIKALGIKAT